MAPEGKKDVGKEEAASSGPEPAERKANEMSQPAKPEEAKQPKPAATSKPVKGIEAAKPEPKPMPPPLVRPSLESVWTKVAFHDLLKANEVKLHSKFSELFKELPTKIEPDSFSLTRFLLDESPEQTQVRKDRDKYREQLVDALDKLEESKKTEKDSSSQLDKLRKAFENFQKESELSYLLTRLQASAHKSLLGSTEFAAKFADGKTSMAYVISIDIRRSTDLMLKASSSVAFARFISTVSTVLSEIMKDGLCVFDKFTGDGMLGFFPDFYSGKDFGYRALKVATDCHAAYTKIYDESREYFDTVLLDTGLGVGIDYGSVQLMRVPEGLTVVGRPVVYACRLSGAPAGKTYVNQSAHTQLSKAHPQLARFEPRVHEIKNEGRIAVSELMELQAFEPEKPNWEE